jgi:DnaJ-domain-containing protein 1
MESHLFRIYLLLAIIILVFYSLRQFLKTPAEVISLMLKKAAVCLLIMVVLFLAVTGRLNWVFALIGVLFACALRILPFLARYLPQLHRLWVMFSANKSQSSKAGGNKTEKMSIKEAYDILGLDSSASKQQIISSHKKLMQKIHPDRGGTDYLAAQINQAKEVLLRNK